MSRKTITFLIAALLTAASPALAGSLGLYGSFWDTDALGETAGAGAKLSFGSGALRFDLRGGYFPDLSEDFGELTDEDDGFVDLEIEATTLEAGLTFALAPGSTFRPYIGGGVTYYMLDTNFFEIDDEVGYYGLAGFELGGRNVGFFAEGMYRVVEGTVTDIDIDDVEIDDEFDLNLEGIAVNAGVVFRF